MLEARSIAAVHQQGSKAQQGVVFDTVNLVRKMCSFAEPKEGYSQVNKDDNEVEAFRPENLGSILTGKELCANTTFKRGKITMELLLKPGYIPVEEKCP